MVEEKTLSFRQYNTRRSEVSSWVWFGHRHKAEGWMLKVTTNDGKMCEIQPLPLAIVNWLSWVIVLITDMCLDVSVYYHDHLDHFSTTIGTLIKLRYTSFNMLTLFVLCKFFFFSFLRWRVQSSQFVFLTLPALLAFFYVSYVSPLTIQK